MTPNQVRPNLDDPTTQNTGEGAVENFVAELQAGLDTGTAHDRSVAANTVWGSPHGEPLTGFGELWSIHRQLIAAAQGAPIAEVAA
ncbi:hypothetical protein [Parasphingorhabdus pacifica]